MSILLRRNFLRCMTVIAAGHCRYLLFAICPRIRDKRKRNGLPFQEPQNISGPRGKCAHLIFARMLVLKSTSQSAQNQTHDRYSTAHGTKYCKSGARWSRFKGSNWEDSGLEIWRSAYLALRSKNSMERLMISSSVIILLSSSATSPRSSLEPLEAAE